jgi:uncharacterized membrane protein YbjE (DUF340 family)
MCGFKKGSYGMLLYILIFIIGYEMGYQELFAITCGIGWTIKLIRGELF